MGGVTSLPVTPGGMYGPFGRKTGTDWAWTQWKTRPSSAAYCGEGEGKANGQTSSHHKDGLSLVSPEDRDTYIVFDGMVKKPLVSAFQNIFLIANWLNIKKVMDRNMWMCFVLTALTYIALNALKILIPCVDSFDIYSI